MTAGSGASATRVMVIGAGWRFTSGISHYTFRLSTALTDEYQVSALLMRRLVPRRMYPGASRVGVDVNDAAYPESIPVYDGVDWYWGRSMVEAIKFIDQRRPEVLILQWWTGAVLHSYVRLARYAARRGAKVILEWHEGQDVGEALLPGARQYVRALMPRLLSCVSGHIVHSNFDHRAITSTYSITGIPVRVIPHGAYDHLVRSSQTRRRFPDQPFGLLYFGVVRPFKGVEDLIEAFSSLTRDQAEMFRLTIVGETWEGWTEPEKAIARSPHADLIRRINRYVTDAEVSSYYDEADAVVLPYHRSSASGPLAIAMSAGLPVVITAVGGLVEAVRDYPGALQVPPGDRAALSDALLRLLELPECRYQDPHSWNQTSQSYFSLIQEVQGKEAASARAAAAEAVLD